jgi:hypothetical protein
MKYNNEFNEINTADKAYVLGFLFGDGSISNYYENNKIRYQTRISISIADEDLLLLIKNKFPFFSIHVIDFSKYNKNSKKQIYITNRSKKLYDDLLKHGMLPRKSYENKEKLSIPNISNNLMHHFIRGYFDADGSVYKLKYRKNLIKIELVSNSYNFINQINNNLINSNINSWKIVTKKPTGRGKEPYYIISIIKQDEIIKFKNFIYNNASIYMERKFNILYNYHKKNKVLDRKQHCPQCNSQYTIRNGKRNSKIRMKCKNCNKNFTI